MLSLCEANTQPRYLSRYDLTGDPSAVRYLNDSAVSGAPYQSTLPELHDPRLAQAYDVISQDLVTFGLERGVDISSRIRPLDSVHLYSRGQFISVGEEQGFGNALGAWSSGHGYLVLERAKSWIDTVATLGHEALHMVTYQEVQVERREDGWGNDLLWGRFGYDSPFLNEILAETGVLNRAIGWSQDPRLHDKSKTLPDVSYVPGLRLFQGMLRASFEETKARDVVHTLQTGMLDGDQGKLADLNAAVGEQVMASLHGLDPGSKAKTRAFAKRHGLPVPCRSQNLTMAQFNDEISLFR